MPDDWALWLDFSGSFATLGDDGKIPAVQVPAIAITDSFAVTSQAAMLALTAQRGDIAIRSDLNKCFVLAADDPTVLNNWKELLTPTDAVLSVAGRTGAVTLGAGDISGLAASATTNTTNASNITSGTLSNSRLSGVALTANNLSDLASAATARTNLGLGAVATLGVGSGLTSGGGNLAANVTSVAGRTGAVMLGAADIAHGIVIAASSVTQAAHTGDTTETTLATIVVPALPAGAHMRLTTYWTGTSSANTKKCKIYYGATGSGTSGTLYTDIEPTTAIGTMGAVKLILNRTTSSQIAPSIPSVVSGFNTSSSVPVTSSVNTTVATELTITGQLANSGETLTLEGYLLEVIMPA